MAKRTLIQRVGRILNKCSIEDAKSVGIEILAQVMAKEAFVDSIEDREKMEKWLLDIFETITMRAADYRIKNAFWFAAAKVFTDAKYKPLIDDMNETISHIKNNETNGKQRTETDGD